MAHIVQVVISHHVGDGEDPKAALRHLLDEIPELPLASDIGQSIDGTWVDEDGDRL